MLRLCYHLARVEYGARPYFGVFPSLISHLHPVKVQTLQTVLLRASLSKRRPERALHTPPGYGILKRRAVVGRGVVVCTQRIRQALDFTHDTTPRTEEDFVQ